MSRMDSVLSRPSSLTSEPPMIALNLSMGRNAPSNPSGEISSEPGHLHFSNHVAPFSKEAKSPEPTQSSIGGMGHQFHAESQRPNLTVANHQAAQAHAKQIEGAIRLLQMQHDAILSSVLTSQVNAMQQQHIVAVELERQSGRFASGQREQINSYLGSTHGASEIISQQASELQRRSFSTDYHSAAITNPSGLHASTAQSHPPCHPHQPEQPTFRQHFDLPFAHRPIGFFPAPISHVGSGSAMDHAAAAGSAGFPAYGQPHAHRRGIPPLPDQAVPPPLRLPSYHCPDPAPGCSGGYGGHDAAGIGGGGGGGGGDGMRPQRSGSSERPGYCGPYQAFPGTFAPPAAAAAASPQAHVQSYFETVRAHRPLEAGPGRPAGPLANGAVQRKRYAEADPLDTAAARPRRGADSAAGAGGEACGGQAQEQGIAAGRLALAPEAACAIYSLRPRPGAGGGKCIKTHSQSSRIAAMHGVTAKTIRDIWNRSTWAKVTRHLWTPEELSHYVDQRRRMSARLDPSHGLPHWCHPLSPAATSPSAASPATDGATDGAEARAGGGKGGRSSAARDGGGEETEEGGRAGEAE